MVHPVEIREPNLHPTHIVMSQKFPAKGPPYSSSAVMRALPIAQRDHDISPRPPCPLNTLHPFTDRRDITPSDPPPLQSAPLRELKRTREARHPRSIRTPHLRLTSTPYLFHSLLCIYSSSKRKDDDPTTTATGFCAFCTLTDACGGDDSDAQQTGNTGRDAGR
jgi:hypothetical protein